eukprot:266760_1
MSNSRNENAISGDKKLVSSPPTAKLRGIYESNDDGAAPGMIDLDLFKDGTDGMLRFRTKDECTRFMKKHCRRGSNPDFQWLQQIFTTLVTWDQVQKYLVSKIGYFNKKYPPFQSSSDNIADNIFMQNNRSSSAQAVHQEIVNRLNLPFHQTITPASTTNTLKYLFFHMRCGIFVMIRNGRLVMFVSFCNKDYENDWGGDYPRRKGNQCIQDYYANKLEFRVENYIADKGKWWANGNIICNEHTSFGNEKKSQYWGDQFNAPLRDLLEDTCRSRMVADCEFFINKRDYPHIKFNSKTLTPVEPYGFIYDKDDRNEDDDLTLKRHLYKSYTPVASFYCSKRFSDLPFPSSEDWEAATGMVYPMTFFHTLEKGKAEVQPPRDLFTEENFIKFKRDWGDKVNTAFFRGTATGGGVTEDTNQRLKCAGLSVRWKDKINHPEFEEMAVEPPFLDAAIVGWNMRDKKLWHAPMQHINIKEMNFEGGKENFTPIYEQSRYKYLIYIEGHCAACRYGFMMRLGSVILKVESSCVADTMWYFPVLKPWVDHVPIKADLSDLAEKIRWCREHDDECRKIANEASELYKVYVHREACLDYVQMISQEINARYRHPPSWWELPPRELPPPHAGQTGMNIFGCELQGPPYRPCWEPSHSYNLPSKPCTRCAEEQEVEKRKEASKIEENKATKNTAARLRERRMKGTNKRRENRLNAASSSTSSGSAVDATPTTENGATTKDAYPQSENSSGWG